MLTNTCGSAVLPPNVFRYKLPMVSPMTAFLVDQHSWANTLPKGFDQLTKFFGHQYLGLGIVNLIEKDKT